MNLRRCYSTNLSSPSVWCDDDASCCCCCSPWCASSAISAGDSYRDGRECDVARWWGDYFLDVMTFGPSPAAQRSDPLRTRNSYKLERTQRWWWRLRQQSSHRILAEWLAVQRPFPSRSIDGSEASTHWCPGSKNWNIDLIICAHNSRNKRLNVRSTSLDEWCALNGEEICTSHNQQHRSEQVASLWITVMIWRRLPTSSSHMIGKTKSRNFSVAWTAGACSTRRFSWTRTLPSTGTPSFCWNIK